MAKDSISFANCSLLEVLMFIRLGGFESERGGCWEPRVFIFRREQLKVEISRDHVTREQTTSLLSETKKHATISMARGSEKEIYGIVPVGSASIF